MDGLRAHFVVLNSTGALLADSLQFGDPATSKRAVEVAFGAIAPLLARGPTTVENAVAAGYPSYPDVDVTSIPSNPDDLISIHVLRIEACSRKLQNLVGAPSGEIIFSTTVPSLAGEFIPLLRSIEAHLLLAP